MAKKIIRKNTRRDDEHRVFIDRDGAGSKEETVRTTCKTFGMLFDDSSQYGMNKTDPFGLIGKCKTCAKQRPEVCEGCMVKSDQSYRSILDWQEKRAPKKTTKKVEKPFSIVIAKLQAGVPRKDICTELVADGFKNNPRSFVNTIAGALNVFEGKESKKPDGTVARTCKWLMEGANGNKPEGDQGTQWYCINTWEALQKIESEIE